VINRGQRKGDFSGSALLRKFSETTGQFPERFGVRIHAYVLMPNHYHLQLELASQRRLSGSRKQKDLPQRSETRTLS